MVSASLVQMNGSQRWFQPAMNWEMSSTSSATLVCVPRRMAWRDDPEVDLRVPLGDPFGQRGALGHIEPVVGQRGHAIA